MKYDLNDLLSLSVSTGAVSPQMARAMRDTMHFERQRPISDKNVERLAEEMRRGWFLAGTPIFICVLPDDRAFIVNGNHTLEAVAASGETLPLVMIRKRVPDMEAVAQCYATFDLQKVRTWRDTMQATGFTDTMPLVGYVVPAVGHIMAGFAYNTNAMQVYSRRARMEAMPDYMQAASILGAALEGCPASGRRVVQRAAVMAVALYTARYQPSAAAEFWGGLAKDDGLAANDPRKALLRYVANNRATGTTRAIHSRAAALAWNAWFEKRPLEVCRPSNAALRIIGTPLHKGAEAE